MPPSRVPSRVVGRVWTRSGPLRADEGGLRLLALWVRATVILAGLTLFARDRTIVLWFSALAVAWAWGGLVLGRVLGGLAVTQAVSSAEAFAGETITVHLRVTNRTIFPLPWLRLNETLPRRCDRRAPQWLASLPPGETFETAYRVRLPLRGVYRIGRVGVQVGDWFGLWRREGYVEVPLWVTVYPRPLQAGLPAPPPRLPEGERRRPSSPFRAWEPAGLREYRRGDPPRWIAWKASARRGDLVVREFPPVRDHAHLIVLDMRPERWPVAHRAAWIERAVSLAAGWVARTAERDEPVGLFAFGSAVRYEPEAPEVEAAVREGRMRLSEVTALSAGGPPRGQPLTLRAIGAEPLAPGPVTVEFPARRGSVHRRQILRALASLEPADAPTFTRAALGALRRMSGGASILWVAGRADEESIAAVAAAARAGHAVALAVAAGTGSTFSTGAPVPGVTVWPMPAGEGEEWDT